MTMMKMSSKKSTGVPLQGDRILRGRREGSAVPAPLLSLSYDGPPTACTAGVVGEDTFAKSIGKARRPVKPGPASSKKEVGERYSLYPFSLSGRQTTTSRAGSPTPSIAFTVTDMCSDVVFLSGVDEDSLTEVSCGSSASQRTKRKKGRPPTTGEYIGLAEAKMRLLDAEQRVREDEEEQDILNSSSDLALKVRESANNMVEEFISEFRDAPLEDLIARVLESQNQVLGGRKCVKGAQGHTI
ncbi:hypothetical protein PUN28_020724 [Cardiocondyla obscurior]|uniref:Uncharacterized protein n=1 Tax=Cardiocondyla obscurior TaxID=286306 RepID=A0AAW2E7Q7_9HYME